MSDETCAPNQMFELSIEGAARLIETSSIASGGMAMTFARSINLSLAIVAGVICIFLGWKLYRDTIISKTTGDVTWRDFRIKLTSSGPGVFLVLFGAWLIYSVIEQRVNFSGEQAAKENVSYGYPADNKQAALNHLIKVKDNSPSGQAGSNRCPFKLRFGVSGFGGRESLISAIEIENALSFAIKNISEDVAKKTENNPDFDLRNHAETVRILTELKDNIVKESM